jgi:DinB superfamily
MDRSYAVENTHERQRLRTLIANLNDEDLTRPLPNGWTVAITLAHLAFWDRQRLAVLNQWERAGVQAAPADADTINEGVRLLAAVIPPRRAAQLAIEAAEAIDQALEHLSADLLTAIEAGEQSRILRRSVHRRAHLDRIDAALHSKPAAG